MYTYYYIILLIIVIQLNLFVSSSSDNRLCLVSISYITILMQYILINFELHNLCHIISYITH